MNVWDTPRHPKQHYESTCMQLNPSSIDHGRKLYILLPCRYPNLSWTPQLALPGWMWSLFLNGVWGGSWDGDAGTGYIHNYARWTFQMGFRIVSILLVCICPRAAFCWVLWRPPGGGTFSVQVETCGLWCFQSVLWGDVDFTIWVSWS